MSAALGCRPTDTTSLVLNIETLFFFLAFFQNSGNLGDEQQMGGLGVSAAGFFLFRRFVGFPLFFRIRIHCGCEGRKIGSVSCYG